MASPYSGLWLDDGSSSLSVVSMRALHPAQRRLVLTLGTDLTY